MIRRRRLAWGGVIGPVSFVAAWAVAPSLAASNYSSIDDAISRLAAVGADSRPMMTAGFIAFGLALPAYAVALRAAVAGPAWIAAATTGVATLAVAALPLSGGVAVSDAETQHASAHHVWGLTPDVISPGVSDLAHGIAAGTGYVSLALTPLLAARPLHRLGRRRLAATGVVAGVVSVCSLAISLAAGADGLFQRLGLTVTDLWLVASVPVVSSLLTSVGTGPAGAVGEVVDDGDGGERT